MRIVKENSSGVWSHKDDENPKIDLIISNGWCKIDGDVFELYGASSGEVRTALITDIILEDASTGGGDETFSNAVDLFLRLKELEYPYFKKVSSVDEIGRRLIGWQDFADSNTSEANPIVQSNVNGGEVHLTNNNEDTATDGNTNVNAETTIEGLNDMYDTNTNTVVFGGTGIEKNDDFDIRVHLNISANIINQDFSVRIDFYDELGANGNLIFSLIEHVATETLIAGFFRERIVNIDGYVGESILNGSGKIYLVGTKSFEVEVIGWRIKILKIAR